MNGKKYRNALRRSYCYYGNGKHWRRNKYIGTSNFDAWTQESEVHLTLMGRRLRKYIELRENWAAIIVRVVGSAIAQRGRSLISTIALWPLRHLRRSNCRYISSVGVCKSSRHRRNVHMFTSTFAVDVYQFIIYIKKIKFKSKWDAATSRFMQISVVLIR